MKTQSQILKTILIRLLKWVLLSVAVILFFAYKDDALGDLSITDCLKMLAFALAGPLLFLKALFGSPEEFSRLGVLVFIVIGVVVGIFWPLVKNSNSVFNKIISMISTAIWFLPGWVFLALVSFYY